MNATPKGNRLHIGIFGRTNVGKSSLLNLIAGQEVAITSSQAGTTTDVVEKTMELLPIGPVVILDTAGLDDISKLSDKRIHKSLKVFERADVILLVLENGQWSDYEAEIMARAGKRKIPVVAVINKIDLCPVSAEFAATVKEQTPHLLALSSLDKNRRHAAVEELKGLIMQACGEEKSPAIIGDLMPQGGIALLVVPIDLEAPKGRIILPQVQTIRDVLDHSGIAITVKESELKNALAKLKTPPDIVVCDSQAVDKVCAEVPEHIPTTTFSILFARLKGDLDELVRGARAIDQLKDGSRILIGEACSHHPLTDDIGREKIPRWLKEYSGLELKIDVVAGREYAEDIGVYDLVIHCGACMLNRKQMLNRIDSAVEAQTPITNYGVCISKLMGVLDRVLKPLGVTNEC